MKDNFIKLQLKSDLSKFTNFSFPIGRNSNIITRTFSMPTRRKQKKSRKSRGLERLSDIENLVIMLGERQSEWEESINSNSARKPESVNSNMFGNNDQNMYLKHREMRFSNNTDPGHNSAGGNSNVEINRLSSELNSRLSREVDEMISSVNRQNQRAISDAISNQILPQI